MDGLDDIEEAASEAAGAAQEKAEEVAAAAQEKAEEAVDKAQEKAEQVVDDAQAKAEEAVDKAEEKASEAVDKAEEKASEAVDKAEAKVSDAVDKAEAKAGEAVDAAEAKVGAAVDAAEAKVSDAVDKAEAAASDAVDKAEAKAGEMADKAVAAATGAVAGAAAALTGEDLAGGGADAAGAAADDAAGAAGGAAAGVAGDVPGTDLAATSTPQPGGVDAPGAGSGSSPATTSSTFQGAKLEIEGKPPIDCIFNPAQYSISKSNSYQVQSIPGVSFGVPQFVGGAPREMTVELLFDVTLSQPAKPSVRPITDALFAMMEVPNGGSGAGSAPPTVTFRWGAFESFKAVPVSLDVRYVLFRPDGEPVRAWAQMQLLQVAADPRTGGGTPAAQNPTTRAAEAGSSCIVCEGDSLPSLAYGAYGDATAWRAIARANGINDPLRLRPGRRIAIPESPS